MGFRTGLQLLGILGVLLGCCNLSVANANDRVESGVCSNTGALPQGYLPPLHAMTPLAVATTQAGGHNARVLGAIEEEFTIAEDERAYVEDPKVVMTQEGGGLQSGKITFSVPLSARMRAPQDNPAPLRQDIRVVSATNTGPGHRRGASCHFRFQTPLEDCKTSNPGAMDFPPLSITDCLFE